MVSSNIKKIDRTIKSIENIEMFLAVIVLTLIIVINILEIIGRYFLLKPLGWAHELSLYLIVWFTYLSVSILVKKDDLIAVDYFFEKFSNRQKRIITIGYEIVLLVVTIIMLRYSFELEKVQKIRNLVTLNLPQSIGLYGFIIASFSIILTVCTRLYKKFVSGL